MTVLKTNWVLTVNCLTSHLLYTIENAGGGDGRARLKPMPLLPLPLLWARIIKWKVYYVHATWLQIERVASLLRSCYVMCVAWRDKNSCVGDYRGSSTKQIWSLTFLPSVWSSFSGPFSSLRVVLPRNRTLESLPLVFLRKLSYFAEPWE